MECGEDELFLAEWIFDESQCGTSVNDFDGSRPSSNEAVALTPPEVVKRVYGIGRAVAEVFEGFSLHFWDSIQYTLES